MSQAPANQLLPEYIWLSIPTLLTANSISSSGGWPYQRRGGEGGYCHLLSQSCWSPDNSLCVCGCERDRDNWSASVWVSSSIFTKSRPLDSNGAWKSFMGGRSLKALKLPHSLLEACPCLYKLRWVAQVTHTYRVDHMKQRSNSSPLNSDTRLALKSSTNQVQQQ